MSLSEQEILAKFTEAMREAEGAATQMGFHRLDERWPRIAKLIYDIRQKAAQTAVSKLHLMN